jgi:hypothetical protein
MKSGKKKTLFPFAPALRFFDDLGQERFSDTLAWRRGWRPEVRIRPPKPPWSTGILSPLPRKFHQHLQQDRASG